MKIVMYGAEICSDCVIAKEQLGKMKDIELDYRNITENTSILKEFLSYRDKETMFTSIKEEGKIGIPFFILEDGRKTFDIYELTGIKKPDNDSEINACSIDGKGNC
ncbi:MAG: glutaredoxin [Clostridiales bacterium]|mgnify:CR=1 FL=1|nr:glutaredoxin [Clostridiales bacterium]